MTDSTKQKLKLPQLNSENEDERISAILTPDQPYEAEDDECIDLPEATAEMLARYHDYLLDKLPIDLPLTGREDARYFDWEEPFEWGRCSPKKYRLLKQQKASSYDKFHLIRLIESNATTGLMVEVKRVTDQKIFVIPLVDLEVCKTREQQLLDDYSNWFVDFGPEY